VIGSSNRHPHLIRAANIGRGHAERLDRASGFFGRAACEVFMHDPANPRVEQLARQSLILHRLSLRAEVATQRLHRKLKS
jgi:hypothetical protein